MAELKKINKQSIQEEVFEQLKQNIISGDWLPETRLPSEDQLAKKLSVSRITIRSALHRLSALGLVESRHGEGTFVRKYSTDSYMDSLINLIVLDKKDINELLEMRRVLEVGIVGIATERVTDNDLESLTNIYENMKANIDDVDAFADYDAEFHLFLADITNNSIIRKVFTVISEIYESAMHQIVGIMGGEEGVYYHGQIIEAMRNKDTELSQKLMQEHIERTIAAVAISNSLNP